MYPRYGMAEPPVPSISNNLAKGWTFRVRCSQNLELMLETCAPESVNAVNLCPSSITGTSLDHPTRWAMGSGFKNGMTGVASHRPVCLDAFMLAGLCLGLGWECKGPTVGWGACHQQGVSHIPSVPLRLV